jgi:hypothetical protein
MLVQQNALAELKMLADNKITLVDEWKLRFQPKLAQNCNAS